MEIIIVFAILFLFASYLPKTDHTAPIIVDKKQCPPHKWQWVEIKDKEGTVHAHKLVCSVCGPAKLD